MRGIKVDADARTVRVEGGCTWGDVDHAHPRSAWRRRAASSARPASAGSRSAAASAISPAGTGSRSTTCSRPRSSWRTDHARTRARPRTPTSSGRCAGGGGNFGVVTAFVFRLHPVSTVVAGPTFWPIEQSAEVLRAYREFLPAADRDLNGFFAFADRAAGAAVPRGAARPPGVRHRVVLHRPGRAGRRGRSSRSRPSARRSCTAPGRCRSPGCRARSTASTRPACSGTGGRTSSTRSPTRRSRCTVKYGARLPTGHSTMHLYPIDGAVHDSRRGRDAVLVSRRHAGPRSSSASTPIRPTPRRSGSGRSTTGTRRIPTRRAAPTSTS